MSPSVGGCHHNAFDLDSVRYQRKNSPPQHLWRPLDWRRCSNIKRESTAIRTTSTSIHKTSSPFWPRWTIGVVMRNRKIPCSATTCWRRLFCPNSCRIFINTKRCWVALEALERTLNRIAPCLLTNCFGNLCFNEAQKRDDITSWN